MTISDLQPYGLAEMTGEEMSQFLDAESVGVLGLPTEGAPYLLPLSYASDGDSSLYFTYLLGEESRKERLTEQAARASFLVYTAETMFNWRSVTLGGTLVARDQSEWPELAEYLDGVWRPEIFRTAETARNVAVYEFEVDERYGIKHTGLAPETE